jgi:5-bromo-4-chloroindolyl phosphate hydrolysis protein
MKNLTVLFKPKWLTWVLVPAAYMWLLISVLWTPYLWFLAPFLMVLYWGRGAGFVLKGGGLWGVTLAILFSFSAGAFSDIHYGTLWGWIVILGVITVIGFRLEGQSPSKSQVPVQSISAGRFERQKLIFDAKAFEMANLTTSDRNFFENELRDANEILKNLQLLRPVLVNLYPDTDNVLAFIVGFISDVIHQPQKLSVAGPFLYVDLPNFASTAINLVNLSDNIVKSSADEELIAQAPTRLTKLYEDMQLHHTMFLTAEAHKQD